MRVHQANQSVEVTEYSEAKKFSIVEKALPKLRDQDVLVGSMKQIN